MSASNAFAVSICGRRFGELSSRGKAIIWWYRRPAVLPNRQSTKQVKTARIKLGSAKPDDLAIHQLELDAENVDGGGPT